MMQELKAIVRSFDMAKAQGKKCALATVVDVFGSSYRRPGARMLIADDGQLTGAISGGCLEGDALKKALHVIRQQTPSVQTYDTMDDDDAIIGIGLGCNGIIKILIEPIDVNDIHNPIELIRMVISQRVPACLVTLFYLGFEHDAVAGTKFVLNRDQFESNAYLDVAFDHDINSIGKEVMFEKANRWIHFTYNGKEYCFYFQYIIPSIKLVIAGAGQDVIPLAEIAETLGYEVFVVDGRANYINKQVFQPSCSVFLAKPEEVLSKVSIDEFTYVALMTHNYKYDKKLLSILIENENLHYIGVLGPRKKITRMLDEFADEGILLSESQIAKIYSPIGINIGAETSSEIALSIIAEIQAVFAGKLVYSLRDALHGIHAKTEMIGG